MQTDLAWLRNGEFNEKTFASALSLVIHLAPFVWFMSGVKSSFEGAGSGGGNSKGATAAEISAYELESSMGNALGMNNQLNVQGMSLKDRRKLFGKALDLRGKGPARKVVRVARAMSHEN